jgi:hypothetical protein
MRFFVPAAAVFIAALSSFAETGSLPGGALFLQGDDAERAGRLGDALKAYTACAAADERLAPFAATRPPACGRVRATTRGEAQWRTVLKSFPRAWTRLAQCRHAEFLAARGRRAEAAALFEPALRVSPRPWFLDEWAWAAAENLMADPRRAAARFPFCGRRWRRPSCLSEKRASRLLLQFSGPEDRALGVWGCCARAPWTRPAADRGRAGGVSGRVGREIALQVLTALRCPRRRRRTSSPPPSRRGRWRGRTPAIRGCGCGSCTPCAFRRAQGLPRRTSSRTSFHRVRRPARRGRRALLLAGHLAPRPARGRAALYSGSRSATQTIRAPPMRFRRGKNPHAGKAWQEAPLLSDASGAFQRAGRKPALCADIAGHCADAAEGPAIWPRAGEGRRVPRHRALARLGKEGGGLSLPGGDPGSRLAAVFFQRGAGGAGCAAAGAGRRR